MLGCWMAPLLFLSLVAGPAVAEDKPPSLSDARAAVEANLRTQDGKTFDERLGAEFVQKHLGALRQCKQSAGGDLRSFWVLLKPDKDGNAVPAVSRNQAGQLRARKTPKGQVSATASTRLLGKRLYEIEVVTEKLMGNVGQ